MLENTLEDGGLLNWSHRLAFKQLPPIKENKMFSVLTNTRNSNLNVVIAVAITLIAGFTFFAFPSVVAPRPASVPAAESQNAYLEYLRGEKVMYTNPVELSNALTAYHLGEKVIVGNALESAMLQYRRGEKATYATNSDISAALWLYHVGEKEIVNTAESALILHHLGEKDLK